MKVPVLFQPRTRLISLVILSALLLYSCDAFKEDMFPAYLGQEQAQIDMTKIREAAGLSSSAFIGQIQPIKIPALQKSYILLTLHQLGLPSALVVLDGKSLEILKTFTEIPIGKFLVLDMDGYIVTGNGNTLSRIDPASLELIDNPTSEASIDFAQFGFSVDVSGLNKTLLIGMENGVLVLKSYSKNSSPWDTVNTYERLYIFNSNPDPSDAGNFYIQDLYYNGSKVRLALRNNLTNDTFIFTWSSVNDFINSFSASNLASGAAVNKVPSGKGDSGGLTRAGCFIRTDNKGPVLELYRLDADNALRDSFTLPPNSWGRFSFFKDGSGWMFYEERADTLHLLRPWWQE
uniref:Uncharacterized protein n=1 Tax=Gracilinema caldarium TaxID=215591 RepID=A0A7C3ED26_9SPIR